MKKHLKTINNIACLIVLTAAISGCGKRSQHVDFAARVNNTYLTKQQLAEMIDTARASNFYRSEVIRNWINRELLYQAAKDKGILKDEEFKVLLDKAQKELAASLLVQKYYDDEKTNYNTKDLEDYYNQHQIEFKRFYDSYLVNIIDFTNEDKAIQFRNTVLESDWEKALNVFKGDSSLYNVTSGKLYYDYEIHPAALSRIVTALNPGELSIVITDEPGHFVVVQEILKFDSGSVPPFDIVKRQVAIRYEAERKNTIIRNYIKELYSKNDIEVRN